MAKPSILPEKRTFLQSLLAEMPYHVSRDPISKPVIISYLYNVTSSSDAATLYIANGLCTVHSLSPYISTEIIILSNYTINDFISYFNGKSAFKGIRMEYAAETNWDECNVLASTLLEGIYTITGKNQTEIDKFTSKNYVVLQSLALCLFDEYNNMKLALNQLDLRLASDKWLDYWGTMFGVSRSGFDYNNDSFYRYRLQAETSGQAATNVGMEDLLSSTLGRNVTVQDGGKPFALSGTYGYAYGIATFLSGSSSVYLSPYSGSTFVLNQTVVTSDTSIIPLVDSSTGQLLTTTISAVAVTGGSTTGSYTFSRNALSGGQATVAASSIYLGNQLATSSVTAATITGSIATSTLTIDITGISTSNRQFGIMNVSSHSGALLSRNSVISTPSSSSLNKFVITDFLTASGTNTYSSTLTASSNLVMLATGSLAGISVGQSLTKNSGTGAFNATSPTIAALSTSGSGATFTWSVTSQSITSITVGASGSGYAVGDIIVINGFGNNNAYIKIMGAGGLSGTGLAAGTYTTTPSSTIQIISGGSGYSAQSLTATSVLSAAAFVTNNAHATSGSIIFSINYSVSGNITASGNSVTLSSGTTSRMYVGQRLSQTSGTGAFGTNVVISGINNSTTFTVSPAHVTTGTMVFSLNDFTSSGTTGLYSVKSINLTNSANTSSAAASALQLSVSSISGNSIYIGQTITNYTSSSSYNTYVVTTGISSGTWGLVAALSGQSGSGTSGSIIGSPVSDPNGINGYLTALTIGPDAGTGSFNVFIAKKAGESALPYSVVSTAKTLINKWKPAGIPFSVQTL